MQGVEAQTIANTYLALNSDLEIIVVLNKIDLPGSDLLATSQEVESTIGLDCTDALACSAKTGEGVEAILETIVSRVPPPPARADEPLRALIFDSYYDSYRGVVVFIRIVSGELSKGDKVRFKASGMAYEALEVGTLSPGAERPCASLRAGEVGYMHGGIKSVTDARVGDTIVLNKMHEEVTPLQLQPQSPSSADLIEIGPSGGASRRLHGAGTSSLLRPLPCATTPCPSLSHP